MALSSVAQYQKSRNKNIVMKQPRLLLILVAAAGVMATTSCKKTGCTDPNAINYNAEAKKDDGSCITVSESRKVTFFEYTATWCGPCGSWGSDAFHETIDDNAGKLVPIAVHASSSDPMYNAVSAAFYNNFTITGWPNFWVGNVYKGTSTNITSDLSTYFGQNVEANAVILVTKNGNMWEVKVQTKFFQSASGEYYIAVYFTEDGINGNASAGSHSQLGTSDPDYKHDHVLRASANGQPWGEKIVDGSVSAGTTDIRTYNVTMDPDWNAANVHMHAIIWKKNGSKYDYVNSTSDVHEAMPVEE
jgi:hypothetical protein